MLKLRQLIFLAAGCVTAMAVYASCTDIRAGCQRNLDLDMAACLKADPTSRDNCYNHANDAFRSCMASCK